ncbi:OLC1v1017089C1 [Oldenlandia corymbosa var. corymbosa]|uniref:OLC1v1017089C1 n=1 Tax=Oldenlandia corymbosa var. corymbosa TaxID=529605 RepID=A0AAV1E8N2_OLDCO|nr:OLC1v1017089C1 [Oldenlandia corymbosa var. corymbosa]
MDPCPFVRLTVGNLALKVPVASKPARTVVHPSSSPCFCKIKLKGFPLQTAVVPCISPDGQCPDAAAGGSTANAQNFAVATFHLSKSDIEKLSGKSIFGSNKELRLSISIYTGRGGTTCGLNSERLLGKVKVPLNLAGTESRPAVFHNGWANVGKSSKSASAQFHLNVRSEPDPRFVFQFDGEPECSPQVFQIQGSIRQPVFTCKFSFRSQPDRNQRSRSLPPEQSCTRSWLSSFGSERERPGKERKGWSITVHDLSGSPVAAASMVTPFVASPGSDRVSRSNPGSWLILRPSDCTWKPWGRLEAWRERGSSDGLGYRFELIPDSAAAGIVLAESTISSGKGGKFVIDLGSSPTNTGGGTVNGRTTPGSAASPAVSPRSSGDFGYGLWPYCMYRGFVMSASVAGEGSSSRSSGGGGGGSNKIVDGKNSGGKSKKQPTVEISVQHVNCTEDAAAFVALSAAIDLSMDACRLFSQKLRKELCPPQDLQS